MKSKPIRKGQALFNAAYQLFPTEVVIVQYSQLIGGRQNVDPFYEDDNAKRFILALAEELNK